MTPSASSRRRPRGPAGRRGWRQPLVVDGEPPPDAVERREDAGGIQHVLRADRRTVSMASADSMPACASGRCASVTSPRRAPERPAVAEPHRGLHERPERRRPDHEGAGLLDESDPVTAVQERRARVGGMRSTSPRAVRRAARRAARPACGRRGAAHGAAVTSTGWPRARDAARRWCALGRERSGDMVLTTDHRARAAVPGRALQDLLDVHGHLQLISEVTVNRAFLSLDVAWRWATTLGRTSSGTSFGSTL